MLHVLSERLRNVGHGGFVRKIATVLLCALCGAPAFAQQPAQNQTQQQQTQDQTQQQRAPQTPAQQQQAPNPIALANRGTVRIITGMEGGSYARTGSDLSILDNDTLRVLTVLGKGSLQNLSDILYLNGIDIGLVQADALTYAKQHNLYPGLTQNVRYIAKLYDEEVHVLARKDITRLEDLNGQRVNADVQGSGSAMTAQILLDVLGIKANIEHQKQIVGLQELQHGEIAAVIHVGGAPIPLFGRVPGDQGLHFLPVPLAPALAQTYLPDQFTHATYPALVPDGPPVSTIAVGDVMAVFDWQPHTERYNKVVRFVDAFFSRFNDLLQPPWDPKWREVNLSAEVPGWTRFKPAQDWLAAHSTASPPTAELQGRFNTFLAQTKQGTDGQLTDAAKAVLFQQFLAWDKQQSAAH
jgi:TRAP transporter TAXI family solute receptor